MAKEKNVKNEKTKKRSLNKDVKAELKKVVWPTSKQMVNNVVAVLTIVIITALIVFALDFAFGAMNKYGIDKLKEKVQAKNTVTTGQIIETKKDDQGAESKNTGENKEDNKEENKEENKENN